MGVFFSVVEVTLEIQCGVGVHYYIIFRFTVPAKTAWMIG